MEHEIDDGDLSREWSTADADGDERAVEAALRPQTLDEVIGQERVREQLGLVLEAARAAAAAPDHVLLSGPPGLGKTTMAMIIAAEMAAPLRITSGPAIQHAGDLAAILSGLSEGEVLFLDEIHRMSRPAEEMLYMAMEDFRVDVVVGKGPGATAIPLEIPPFTLVGATTRAGLLPGPLRDRFGFTGHLEFYETGRAAADRHPLGPAARGRRRRRRGAPRSRPGRAARRASPTGCCVGCATSPRSAADGAVTRALAHGALALFEVDESGPRPARPCRARRAVPSVRRRTGRAEHAGGRRRRGARDGRGGRRAVPGPVRLSRPHAARPGRDAGGLGSTSAWPCPPARPSPTRSASSTTLGRSRRH